MVYILTAVCILILDQVTKKITSARIKEREYVEVVKDRLYFTNIKNEGAAYGLFSGKPKLLFALTAAALAGLIRMFVKLRSEKRLSPCVKFSFACITGGAAGNIMDRIRLKKVTDFIYIKFKNAPIFNIADFFIFLGAITYMFNMMHHKRAR